MSRRITIDPVPAIGEEMDVRVIGLGNVLMGDDAFGPYVVKTLEALYESPADVSLIDAGTPGLDLSPFPMDADVVILVDAVKASGEAGSVEKSGRISRSNAAYAHP